jgi:hypothetical protein
LLKRGITRASLDRACSMVYRSRFLSLLFSHPLHFNLLLSSSLPLFLSHLHLFRPLFPLLLALLRVAPWSSFLCFLHQTVGFIVFALLLTSPLLTVELPAWLGVRPSLVFFRCCSAHACTTTGQNTNSIQINSFRCRRIRLTIPTLHTRTGASSCYGRSGSCSSQYDCGGGSESREG